MIEFKYIEWNGKDPTGAVVFNSKKAYLVALYAEGFSVPGAVYNYGIETQFIYAALAFYHEHHSEIHRRLTLIDAWGMEMSDYQRSHDKDEFLEWLKENPHPFEDELGQGE